MLFFFYSLPLASCVSLNPSMPQFLYFEKKKKTMPILFHGTCTDKMCCGHENAQWTFKQQAQSFN